MDVGIGLHLVRGQGERAPGLSYTQTVLVTAHLPKHGFTVITHSHTQKRIAHSPASPVDPPLVSASHSHAHSRFRFCVLIGQWYTLYGFDSRFSTQRMPTISTAIPLSVEGIVVQLFFITIRYLGCLCLYQIWCIRCGCVTNFGL